MRKMSNTIQLILKIVYIDFRCAGYLQLSHTFKTEKKSHKTSYKTVL